MTDDGSSSPPAGPSEPRSELVLRLRARAAELRATTPEPEPELEAETEPIETPDEAPGEDDETFSGPTHGVFDDPADSELLRRWADEDHIEAVSPRRNWTPLVVVLFLAAIAALVFVAFRSVGGGSDEDAPSTRGGDDAEASSVLDADAPTLDDLTADVTIPPGPAEGLTVADKGVTVVEDRFDPAKREGTFAVILHNPHAGWLAQSVQVGVSFLDDQGATVGSDTAFVEVVLPGQTVAVASHFFDAPTAPVVDLAVTVDVARWRETEPFEGTFITSDAATEEAEFSGLRTSFLLRSTFDRALSDVGITVVYRGVFGQIVGGYDTFVDLLEPEVETPVDIALLANIPLEAVTATELYPYAGFGFVPDG